MEIIEQLKKYFETELNYLRAGLDKEDDLKYRSDIAWYCVQRCLGACQFAEMCGADPAIVEGLFEGMKMEIENLQNTP